MSDVNDPLVDVNDPVVDLDSAGSSPPPPPPPPPEPDDEDPDLAEPAAPDLTAPTFAETVGVDQAAADLWEAIGPAFTADDHRYGYPLLKYLDGSQHLLGEAVAAADWTAALDVDRAPATALPWLGQFHGVEVTADLSDVEARDLIRTRRGRRRGTPAAILAEIRATLTGGKTVEMTERDGGAYQLRVRVYDSETTSLDDLRAAIGREKPAGLVLTLEVFPGQDYAAFKLRHATYADARAAYTSYAQARATLP